jgi:hypothetical protein
MATIPRLHLGRGLGILLLEAARPTAVISFANCLKVHASDFDDGTSDAATIRRQAAPACAVKGDDMRQSS